MKNLKENLEVLVKIAVDKWYLVLYSIVCTLVVLLWFMSGLGWETKIPGSLVSLLLMVFNFIWLKEKDSKYGPPPMFVQNVILSSLSLIVFAMLFGIPARTEILNHHPKSIQRFSDKMIVVSENGNVLTNRCIKYYISPDSNICIQQIKNWNDFGFRIKDTYDVGFCE